MTRKILIGIAVLVALVVAGAGALLLFVDINRFKPQIEQAAQQRLQRRLSIEGDLSLSVFPRIAVRLPRSTFAAREGTGTLLSLESANVGVALWPLLHGRVQIDRIRVDGLNVMIRRGADGTTDIDDLLHAGGSGAGAAQKSDSAPADVEIGGIELVNAEIGLKEPAGTTTLSKLDLKTGRIAPGAPVPITLSSNFALPSKASGAVVLKATLSLDPSQRAYGAAGVELTVRGRFDQDDIEAKLAAPRFALGGDAVSADAIALTLARAGANAANIKLDLAAFNGTPKALRIDKVEFAAQVQQGARRIGTALAGPAQASIEAQTLSMPRLAGSVTIDDPALPGRSMKLPLTATLALDARKQALDVRADTRFDDTTLSAKIDIDNFSKPQIGFDLRADQFNLDRYSPPAAATPTATKAAATTPAATSSAASPDARVDLSALRGLNATGQVSVGQLQARGIKASNVRAAVKATGGRAEFAPVTAQLYGGTLAGVARAAAEGNRVALDANLANVAVGPLLKDVLQKDPIEGRGSIKLAVATAGATVNAMKHGLGGTASIRLRDGAVRGINIAQKVRDARALILGGKSDAHQADRAEKTDFSELNVSFNIQDGVASSNDLDLKSPLLRVGGTGRIDLGASRIDYTARVAVVGSLTGQDGRALTDLRGVAIPVRLSGPFDQLSYHIDWGGVAREALKSKLTEDLKQRLSPQSQDKQKKIEERARDALKGLLGR